MHRTNLLPFSIRHSGVLLATDPHPHESSLPKHLRTASKGGALAVDLVPVLHDGSKVEVGHRLFKQAFGAGKCLCRRFAAHLKHEDLVLVAFLEVGLERFGSPFLGWRRAQEVVAARRKNAVPTGIQPLVA